MTQSTSPGRNLRLILTPMQLSSAVATGSSRSSASLSTQYSTPNGQQVVLYPGEPSELVVQIENLGTRPVQLNLQLEGSFPANWCRIGMEGYELAPRQRMEAVLYFQIPANFFEDDRDFVGGEALTLEYHSRIYVYYTEVETNRRLIESADFNLFVRPRSLYVNFLPALYSEVDFIGRLLSIFEQAFEPTVQTLDVMWANLHPLTAPQAMLPFLAHWVAWQLDSRWTIEKQRRLVANALQIYRWRGTKRGLRFYLHLYTDLPLDEHIPQEADKHIGIEEVFGDGFVLGGTRLGQDAIIGGGRPFHFIVRLRPDADVEIDEPLIRQIIEQEKPAFCTYELYIETRNLG